MAYYNELAEPASVIARQWQPVVNFDSADHPAGSPLWWANVLTNELRARQPLVAVLEDYYEGRHRFGLATEEYKRVFGKVLGPVSDAWMSLVVRASAERLKVEGFRIGEGQILDADREAWSIWQWNNLDEDSALLHTEAIKLGEAYLLVWQDAGDRYPRITVEHPAQMIVARSPVDRRTVAAALKYWLALDGAPVANLYLPDRIVRLVWDAKRGGWRPRGGGAETPNPVGVVPVVPVTNDPHSMPCYPPSALLEPPHSVPGRCAVGLGRSDLADVIGTQDVIDKLLRDLIVASELGAHRQLWMTGVDPDTDENGKAVPIEVGAGRNIAIPSESAKVGNLDATDLSNYTGVLEQRIQSLASRASIPVHYLLGGQGNFPSGESLRSAETGLVAKIRAKQVSFGGAYERAMRLAFAWMGDPRKDAIRAEVDWKDPEYRTESEFIDAQVKKLALGIPPQQIWEDIGYSPQQIDRMRAMIRQSAVEGALLDPLALNPNGGVETPQDAGQPSFA